MVRRRTYLKLVAGGIAGTAVGTGPGAARVAQSDPGTESAKLVADDGSRRDAFGGAVAVSGGTVLVGAGGNDIPNDPNNTEGDNKGSAYVFERADGSWSQQARLTGEQTDHLDSFGRAVALDGDTAVIGAPGDEAGGPADPTTGAAYVFARSNGSWSQQVKLTPDDVDEGDRFGSEVALDGDTALISSVGDEDPNGTNAGSAYAFARSNGSWSQQAKLAAADGDGEDSFGHALALSGDTAVVGAPNDEDPNGRNAGAAYAFERSSGSWGSGTKLVPDDGAESDYFGWSVAADGDTLLVGAFNDENENGNGAGTAYAFERSNGSWSQQSKFIRSGEEQTFPYSNDQFGSAVALNGDRAVVGAPDDHDPNGEAGSPGGSAYVFARSNGSWSQQRKIVASDGDGDDQFGTPIGLDGGTAIIGAENDEDPNGEGAGSAYVFEFGSGSGDGDGDTGDGTPSPPDVTGDGNPAADPDGDGRYEDVNGDGDTTPGDATVLFNRVFDGDPAVMDNKSLFDFNGDGGLTPGDATVLFDEIF